MKLDRDRKGIHRLRWASHLGVLVALLLTMIGVAALTGRLNPHAVADTPSYVNYPFDSLDGAMRSIRTPGYPLLLKVVSTVASTSAIPWIQILLHAIASWWLWIELRKWGTTNTPAIAAMIAVAIGCTFMDNVSTLATDAPAASFGVMTAVAMMSWVRCGQPLGIAIVVALLSVIAISLRPAYLAMVPWTLLCGFCFHVSSFNKKPKRLVARWLVAPALITIVVLGWMGLRSAVVGDFGVLPFGHQNLAGITVQLVNDEELLATKGNSAALAAEVIRQRDQRIAEGFRFTEGDPKATMTIEGRWNDVIYQVVVPAARTLHGDDSITNHDAIAALNKQIVRRYPIRYVRWLLLASRRAAWVVASDIVMHPIFLTAILFAVLVDLFRRLKGIRVERLVNDDGLSALFIVAVTYAVVQIGFVILTSPPLGRFADAGAILLPAWIAARTIEHFQSLKRGTTWLRWRRTRDLSEQS